MNKITLYEKASVEEDPKSLYRLAMIYFNVLEDYEEAFVLLKKSAKQDYIKAQRHLSFMYKKGYGVESNHNKYFYWLEKSAKLSNDKFSTLTLGLFYYKKGCYKEAIKWFEKSAEKNLPLAQYFLATVYYNGAGIIKNTKKSLLLLKKLAKQEFKPAQQYLKNLSLS